MVGANAPLPFPFRIRILPSVKMEFKGSIAEFHGLFCGVFRCKPCQNKRVRFSFGVGLVTQKSKKADKIMEITITNEQKVGVALFPVTDTGKPAKLDGSPAWTVLSGNSQVIVADDGLSVTLISSDDPGETEVIVKADADTGEGIVEISGVIKLIVVAAKASNLGLVAGTPEPK